MKYKITYNENSDTYNVKRKDTFLKIFWQWNYAGYLDGAAGHVWVSPFAFKTKEEAMLKIVELIEEDHKQELKERKMAQKKKENKDIVISSEDIKEKFPELYL